MIVCGWCAADTTPGRCSACGRDPALPWLQRGDEPPQVTEAEIRFRAIRMADAELRKEGHEPTIDRLAERLGVDPRTVRRWRQMSAPRPSNVRPTEAKVQP